MSLDIQYAAVLSGKLTTTCGWYDPFSFRLGAAIVWQIFRESPGKVFEQPVEEAKEYVLLWWGFISAVGFFTMLGSRFSQRMETLVPLRSLDVLEVYVEVVRRMCMLACFCYLCETQTFNSDKLLPRVTQ